MEEGERGGAMEYSPFAHLLEKTRLPHPSFQRLAVVSIFQKLSSAPPCLGGFDSDPGRDALSRCLTSPPVSERLCFAAIDCCCRDSSLGVMCEMASPLRANESGSPKEHIERMRRERYYIGRDEESELSECMHNAVNYLSEELYSKDVHFPMELIQNAEDNEYPSDVVPSLEFVITSKDIPATGAMSTLLVFNNEKGFSPMNIEYLCKVGSSTKKGKRHCGYTGEKGK